MWQQFGQAFGDFTQMDLNAVNNQWAAQQNGQMNAQLQGEMQQAMANPQIQEAYRQYQMRGGPMNYHDFVYGWMATAGYSPQGIQKWRESENFNQHQEWIAQQGLKMAEMQRGQAQMENWGHFHHNQSVFGQNLMGQANYETPMGPQTHSYTLPPGYHDTPQGRIFVNVQGEYFQVDAHGNHYQMHQNRGNLPFR
jgi:hypothetical protein